MLVFDLETNGLLDSVTKIHCINMIDTETGERLRYNGGKYADGTRTTRNNSIDWAVSCLANATRIAGQNIIKYDIPVIQKLYPGWKPKGRVFDTRVASQVIWTNMADLDFAMLRSGKLPPEFQKKGLISRHKLAAWGYRLGLHKGDFDPADYGHTWATMPFIKDMDDYCALDCEVTFKWIEAIEKKNYSQECLDLEHRVAEIIAQQERNGFRFDVKAAEKLYAELQSKRASLTDTLTALFPPWKAKDGKPFVPKRDNAKLGYKAGVPVQKYKTVVFNPASRDHIANRLIDKYGWNPEAFTDGGKPKVDETVLSALTYPEASKLAEYMLLEKRLGQIGDGDQAWLKQERNGRIHGTVNTNGAVTGRMTHSNPNVAQVPRVGSPYGAECRACFVASPGYVLVGCDAEGLELRMLAHYMALWDHGEYGEAVVNGKKENGTDVHTVNQKAMTLNSRDSAKTAIYALIYGAGDYKLGTIVYDDFDNGTKARFNVKYTTEVSRKKALARLGKDRRAKIMAALPALAKLTDKVKAAAKKRGYLIGLDGRRLHVRSEHAALNTLLQSGGAVVMKKALVLFEEASASIPHKLVANIHDEIQMETQPETAEELGKLCADSIRRAGEHFKLRCPLSGSYGIGPTWAHTH